MGTMRKRGLLTREEAIKIVGGNTVKAVGYVARESTGIELIDECLVEFVVSIEAVDLDGEAVILSAYYYQAMDVMDGAGEDLSGLDWKISGYEVQKGDISALKMRRGVSRSEMLPRTMTGETPSSEVINIAKPEEMVSESAAAETAPKKPKPHVFVLRGQEVSQGTAAAAQVRPGAVGFDYPVTLRGSTAHFHIYYDPSLGINGQTIADGVLASCEAEYNILSAYFGGITPASFNIIIAPGVGGAYHYGCSATDLYCDASGLDVNHTRMLLVAEEVEVFSALQNRGWDCGASNGEGLSRALSAALYPGSLNGFNSASTWLDTPRRPDYVNVNDPTDRSYVSAGCSVLFLNYLRYQLGYEWRGIVQAAGTTLAHTYQNLTGLSDALTPFKGLLQAHYPAGTPSGLNTDNPFPLPIGAEA